MTLSQAWINGEIMPADSPAVPAVDRGFLFGLGIYETTVVIQGIPLFLEEHLRRMEEGRAFLGLPASPWPIPDAVRELLARESSSPYALRITLTGGAGKRPTLALTVRALNLPENPVCVVVSPFTKDAKDPFESHKTVCRARHYLSRKQAQEQGAFDALFRDPEGFFLEGTVSNLFLVRNGELHTPPVSGGVLPGVTRQVILDGAKRFGLPFHEGRVSAQDLAGAEEVFLTNSLHGVYPVREVQGIWQGGAPGPVSRRIQASYQEEVQKYLKVKG